jgi:hypothetical protein
VKQKKVAYKVDQKYRPVLTGKNKKNTAANEEEY